MIAYYLFLVIYETCSTNKFETQLNFCDDWCNTEGIWGCDELNTLISSDDRNTENVDYNCNCNGCNGCSNSNLHQSYCHNGK